jgi:hypothetical protein
MIVVREDSEAFGLSLLIGSSVSRDRRPGSTLQTQDRNTLPMRNEPEMWKVIGRGDAQGQAVGGSRRFGHHSTSAWTAIMVKLFDDWQAAAFAHDLKATKSM